MKKLLIGFLSCAFLVLLLVGTVEAQMRFGFRAYGGLNYLSPGDVNTGVEGWSNFYRAIILQDYTASGEFKPLNLGFDFGGELLLHFSPQFALGLGGGYITASKKFTMNYTQLGELPVTYTSETKMGAIPIRLSLYYFLPIGPAFNVSFHAGAGYYLASLNLHHRAENAIYFEERTIDNKGGGLGFHGGFGLEIVLSPMISLVFDVTGRVASFSNFTGDFTQASTGWSATENDIDLYLVKYNLWPFGTYDLLIPSDTTPSGADIISAARAKVSFTGISSFLGFLFRF